jgi:hypothetical protein
MTALDTNVLIYSCDKADQDRQAWVTVKPCPLRLRDPTTNSHATCQSNTASVVLEIISSPLFPPNQGALQSHPPQ